MFAQNERLNLLSVDAEVVGQQRAEAQSVENGAKSDDAVERQAEFVGGQLGQNVDRVGDHNDVGVGGQGDFSQAVENFGEQLDVAVDEIESAFCLLYTSRCV